MAAIPAALRTKTGDRLHSYLNDAVVYYATLDQANQAFLGQPPTRPCDFATFRSQALPVEIVVPLHGVFEQAMKGVVQSQYDLPIRAAPKIATVAFKTSGLNSLSLGVGSAIFALSCDEPLEWLKTQNSNYPSWPPVSNFCRVVRNTISHGGSININSPNAATVSWSGLSYGFKDDGRRIIGTDLSFGDLLILMFQLESEIDQLRAGLGGP